MRIDNSRYTAFWSNPEKYRLTYERNICPAVVPFPLARGIHLHSLHEARNKGLDIKATAALTVLNKGISKKAQDVGTAMYEAFKKKYDGDSRIKLVYDDGKPLAEMEFEVAIPDSPHFIIGKMDEVIEYKGELWLGDLKTANAKATKTRKESEFRYSSQPLFYLNAARMLGYDVKGMLYRVVTEHAPPQIFEIEQKRTKQQLALGLLNIHQTCELIEFMRDRFGIDKPWPHLESSYPCNFETSTGRMCEYAEICGRMKIDPEELEGFSTRVDHIDLMRGREFANGQ